MSSSVGINCSLQFLIIPLLEDNLECTGCKRAWVVDSRYYRGLQHIGRRSYCVVCYEVLFELQGATFLIKNPTNVSLWVRIEIWSEDFKCAYECKDDVNLKHSLSRHHIGRILMFRYAHNQRVQVCFHCFLKITMTSSNTSLLKTLVKNG